MITHVEILKKIIDLKIKQLKKLLINENLLNV